LVSGCLESWQSRLRLKIDQLNGNNDAIVPEMLGPGDYIVGAGILKAAVQKTLTKTAIVEFTEKKAAVSAAEGRFNKAVSNLSEEGQQNVRSARNWAGSKGYTKKPGSGVETPEQWGEKLENGKFSWRLKIKPEASTREGLESGSNVPRISARLDDKGTYVNPFTGKTGGKEIGEHIPLENPR
jgi:hypothetical protein